MYAWSWDGLEYDICYPEDPGWEVPCTKRRPRIRQAGMCQAAPVGTQLSRYGRKEPLTPRHPTLPPLPPSPTSTPAQSSRHRCVSPKKPCRHNVTITLPRTPDSAKPRRSLTRPPGGRQAKAPNRDSTTERSKAPQRALSADPLPVSGLSPSPILACETSPTSGFPF